MAGASLHAWPGRGLHLASRLAGFAWSGPTVCCCAMRPVTLRSTLLVRKRFEPTDRSRSTPSTHARTDGTAPPAAPSTSGFAGAGTRFIVKTCEAARFVRVGQADRPPLSSATGQGGHQQSRACTPARVPMPWLGEATGETGRERCLLGHFPEDELQWQVDRRGVCLMVNQLDVPVTRDNAHKRDGYILSPADRLEQLAVLRSDQQCVLLLVPECQHSVPTNHTSQATWHLCLCARREADRARQGREGYSAPQISSTDIVGSPTMNLSTSIVAPNGSTISCR